MSMVIIKMQQHQMDEMGECIDKGLRAFGRAMSIYEDMKHSGSMGERNDRDWQTEMGNRYPSDMGSRYPMEMRYPDEMGERRGRDSMGRYTRY